MGKSTPNQTNLALVTQSVEVVTKLFVKAREDELDDALLNLYAEAYAAVMTSNTLGLAYVIEIEPPQLSDPQTDGEGSRPVMFADLTWTITFRHGANSLEI